MHGSLTSPKPSASQRIPAKLEMFKKLQEITGLQLEQRRDLGGAETAQGFQEIKEAEKSLP